MVVCLWQCYQQVSCLLMMVFFLFRFIFFQRNSDMQSSRLVENVCFRPSGSRRGFSIWFIWLAATLQGLLHTFPSEILSHGPSTQHVPVLMEQKRICFRVFPKPSPSLCFVCQFLPGRPRTIQFSYSKTKSEFKPPQLKAQGILLRISDTNLCWVGFFVNIVNRIFCNISSLFGRTSDAVFSFSLFPPSVCLSLFSSAFFSLSLVVVLLYPHFLCEQQYSFSRLYSC